MYFTKRLEDNEALCFLSKMSSQLSFPIGKIDVDDIVWSEYTGRTTSYHNESILDVVILDGSFEVEIEVEAIGFCIEELGRDYDGCVIPENAMVSLDLIRKEFVLLKPAEQDSMVAIYARYSKESEEVQILKLSKNKSIKIKGE